MAFISVAREAQKPQDYASDGSDAIGFLQFWGNSPALDLLSDQQASAYGPAAEKTVASGIYEQKKEGGGEEGGGDDEPMPWPLPEGDETINILIIGGADMRHLVKTVSRRRRQHAGQRLRFFLHESHHEVLARHLLFLQIVNNKALPVRERMEIFLSLYGNTLVRERDSTYVNDIASEFVELVTDNSTHPLAEIVDLTQLKYRDRDVLQDIFKGWFKGVTFDVESLREMRCRGYYRERYDYRKNLMDWDYTTYIKECAGIINWFHYKEFCHTGVAFETRLASYKSPNQTLASYTEGKDRAKGTTVQVRGFWGDIINSPYHAFCTTTNPEDRARLFKISGSQYRHTETDIAEFNVTAFISEMETGDPFRLPPERPEEHVYPYASPLEELRAADKIVEVTEEKKESSGGRGSGTSSRSGSRASKQKADWPPLLPAFEGVEVVLLCGDLKEILRKQRYQGLFHRAFVGSMAMLPILEELGLTKAEEDCFRAEDRKIRRPPRLEEPGLFGQRRARSSLAGVMAPGSEVVFETMKYQAHFEGAYRLGFRHRLAQVGHLSGWRLLDERRAVPQMEMDMPENKKRELDKNSTDFLRFVALPGLPQANADRAQS